MHTARSTRNVKRRRYARDCARAYMFQLSDRSGWLTYIGLVRNRGEATRALKTLFGDRVTNVRVHPVCDPWPKARENRSVSGAPMPKGGDHGHAA